MLDLPMGRVHVVGQVPEKDSDDWIWYNPASPPIDPHVSLRMYKCEKCTVTWRHKGTVYNVNIRCWCCGRFQKR